MKLKQLIFIVLLSVAQLVNAQEKREEKNNINEDNFKKTSIEKHSN